MHRSACGAALIVLLGLSPFAVAQSKSGGSVNVRENFELTALMTTFSGVVEEVGERNLTLLTRDVPKMKREKASATFRPVDLLAGGKLLQGATAGFAYLWQDVKKGDSLQIYGKYDRDEERWYCLAVCIWKRPGAKLPESQDAKNDAYRYRQFSFLNDIENGEDKSEKEIVELFPPEEDRQTGRLLKPTTFPPMSRLKLALNRAKLDAEREKKEEKGLKAAPPEKKDK